MVRRAAHFPHTPSPTHLRPLLAAWADVIALPSILVVFVIIAGVSLPLPNVGFAQDLGVFLDAGWRFFQGQRCHADYRSGLGPVFAMLSGIPFRLCGPEYASLRFLPVTITCIFSIWTLAIIRKTMPATLAVPMSLAIGLYAGGIFHPGSEPQALTFAAFYNRVGFGLISVICTAAFLPTSKPDPKFTSLRDASAGIALTLALFLKVNFFLLGGLAILVGGVATQKKRSDWLWTIAAALCTALLLLPFIGFRLDRMASDLALAAALRKSVVSGLTFFPVRNFSQNLDFFAILALQTVCMFPTWSVRAALRRIPVLCTLWLPAVLGFCLTLIQSHGNGRCFPTVIAGMAAAWPMLEQTNSANRLGRTGRRVFAAGAVLASALIVVPHAYSYVWLSTLTVRDFNGDFDCHALRDLKVGPFNNWGQHFTPLHNEAISLIRKHCKRSNSLQYIDLANLFSFGLGLRSPIGSMLWWDDRATYSPLVHPNDDIFDDTDFILVPATVALHPQPAWKEVYGDYVEKHFYEVERSANFQLLARRDR